MVECSPAIALPMGIMSEENMNAGHTENAREDIESLSEHGFALAIQLLGRHEDAADVVQDSLHKLVHSGQYDARRGPKRAWFLKVVRNGALDVLRKRKPEDKGAVAQLEDTDLSPAEAAEQNELKTIIQQQLDEMDVAQREIVLLRDFHDLSYAEIADVMDIRAGTVMSRLHRARKELRQRMRRYL
jgi:RNA polymerase sigma-70 factor (ECF subfamily)